MRLHSLLVAALVLGALPAIAHAGKPELPPPGEISGEPGTIDVWATDSPESAEGESAGQASLIDLEGELFADPVIEPEQREVVVVVPQPAAPEEIDMSPRQPRTREGTFSVLELNAGATLGGRAGEAGSALLGVGGKPVGFPWRFYFITEIGQAHILDSGTLESGMYESERRYWNLAAGLRIYIPVVGAFRLFADATLGGAYVTSSLLRRDLDPLQADDWNLLGTVAAGVQARVLHHLSFGVRGKIYLVDDGLSDLRDRLDIAGGLPTSVTAGLTWHI